MKKGKVNTSKGAGYTPFSREDINLDDGRNTKAEELFLKMLDVPKRVQKKKKKGKETEIVDDDFYHCGSVVYAFSHQFIMMRKTVDKSFDKELSQTVYVCH